MLDLSIPARSLFLSPAVVQHARSGSSGGLSAGAVAGIAVGTMLGVLLIAGSVYGINQWRQYMAIRPQVGCVRCRCRSVPAGSMVAPGCGVSCHADTG